MRSKSIIKHSFTLVELLVSMSIFSILLVIIMQFFGGAQSIITRNGQNKEIYADARVAMNMMSTLISSAYYSADCSAGTASNGEIDLDDESSGFLFNKENVKDDDAKGQFQELFLAVKPDPDNDFFNGDVENNDKIRSVYFVRIYRYNNETSKYGDSDTLRIDFIKPDFSSYDELFPPYTAGWSKVRSELMKLFRSGSGISAGTNTTNVISRDIVKHVVGLEFEFFEKKEDNDDYKVDDSTYGEKTPPYMIEVRLSLLSPHDYRVYKRLTDDKKKFRLERARTFTRRIYLGDKNLFKD